MSNQLPLFSNLLQAIRSTSVDHSKRRLTDALSLLFEPSPTLTNKIVPSLIQCIYSSSSDNAQLPRNYATLIDAAIELVSSLPEDQKAGFISAHPRIGEVRGLSTLSAAEQGQGQGQPTSGQTAAPQSQPTPSEVLERLAFLNAAYEQRYPGLVYITFVNGRSRTQIRDELEDKLRVEGVLPAVDSPEGLEKIVPHGVNSEIWKIELERAIATVRDIAHSRLQKLNVE